MNPPIQELADQASLHARADNSSMLFENFQKRYTEKLVELIVNECAKIADKAETYKSSDLIKKHFGV